MKKTVVFGVTSGIAAYKSVELVKQLKKEGVTIHVVMTASASKMVNPKEFEKASGNRVYTELFDRDFDYKAILKARKVDHIDLADRADVIVVAPATANILTKIAQGIADDFLTTLLLAANSPIVLCPSMNAHMWNNPIVKEHVATLQKRGFIIIPPERGMLACGYEGPGRLAHLEAIQEEILRQITYSKSLLGKKVLVTAGGTIEKIDDVRFIGNKSTGKMGASLADECVLRGAEVTLLRARSAVEPRYVMQQVEEFETIEDLQELVRKHVSGVDIVIHTAAVGDFRVKEKQSGKTSSKKGVVLALSPAIKISNTIKQWNPKVTLVLFKAEYAVSEEALVKRAKEKLLESDADVIVANDVSKKDRGFAADTNEVLIVTKTETKKITLRSKREVAKEVVTYLSKALSF